MFVGLSSAVKVLNLKCHAQAAHNRAVDLCNGGRKSMLFAEHNDQMVELPSRIKRSRIKMKMSTWLIGCRIHLHYYFCFKEV